MSDKSTMKVIYIAGPYRSKIGEWFVQENIRTAEKSAIFVWQLGGVAICPHKNTALFGGMPGCPDETWLAGDLEIIRRCDAIWAITGWRDSQGATAEVAYARDNDIPVLFTHDEVAAFLKKNEISRVYRYKGVPNLGKEEIAAIVDGLLARYQFNMPSKPNPTDPPGFETRENQFPPKK